MQLSHVDDIVLRLNNFLNQDRCAVWIGAGLSSAVGYPQWPDLIAELCEKCSVSNFDQLQRSDTEYLQTMADTCKDFAPIQYRQHLEERFGGLPRSIPLPYLHLIRLDLHAYVTTNFDSLLLTAAQNTDDRQLHCYPDITPRGLEKKGGIFHIHGLARKNDSPNAQNLVLSKSEFESAYGGATWCFLYDFLTYFPILFLGYRVGEREVKELVDIANISQRLIRSEDKKRNPPKRMILLAKDEGSDQAAQVIARQYSDLQVEVLQYDPIDSTYSGFDALLERLCNHRDNLRIKRSSGYSAEYPE